MTLSSHHKRIVTSILLLPLIAWVIISGDPALSIGLVLVASLGLLEFYAMFWPGRENLKTKITGLLLGGAMFWFLREGVEFLPFFLIFLFWFPALTFLRDYARTKQGNDVTRSVIMLSGLLYLPAVLQLFRAITPLEILLILLTTFAADTGAYYAGTWWGRRKVWPVISPKKTWAGSLGGLGLCTALCLIFGVTLGTAPWWAFLFLGVALNVAAQFGDFFESALKRWRGVKDSGRLLPGHGGILDRIDSLLLTLPVYCLLAAFVTFF
jgi:phosphatidate cytidylyltransferase